MSPRAGGLGWGYVAHLVFDPKTYLWFLAYLFVFHVVSLGLPSWLRVVGGPLVLTLACQADPSADWHKFAWLFGWFLVGDSVGRVVRRWLRAAPVPPRDVLGFVGRNSLVFYVSHLIVIIFVTVLVRARRHAPVNALFVPPRLLVGTTRSAVAHGPMGGRQAV